MDKLRLIFYELINPSVCIYNFVQIIYFIESVDRNEFQMFNYWTRLLRATYVHV